MKLTYILSGLALGAALTLTGCSSEPTNSLYYGSHTWALSHQQLKDGYVLTNMKEIDSTYSTLSLPVSKTIEHTTSLKVESDGKCVVEVSDRNADGATTIKKYPYPCQVDSSNGVITTKASTIDLDTGKIYEGRISTENQVAYP